VCFSVSPLTVPFYATWHADAAAACRFMGLWHSKDSGDSNKMC